MDVTSYLLGKQAGGGSGGDVDWSALGYQETPQTIVDGYNYSLQIKEGWQSPSKLGSDSKLILAPLIDTSQITDMENFFYFDISLLEIPLLDTSSAITMKGMFSGCKSLQRLPLLDTSNVTTMYEMFKNCTNLVTVPNFNTSKVANMNSLFYGCGNLESFPLLDTSNVTNMQNMTNGCNKLKNLPKLNTSKVTSMQNAFVSGGLFTDESLNNILLMCIGATSYTGTKTLRYLGLTSSLYPNSKIQSLPSYQDFIDAGWTTGY